MSITPLKPINLWSEETLNFALQLQHLVPGPQRDLTSPANDFLWDPADLAREFSFLTNIFN